MKKLRIMNYELRIIALCFLWLTAQGCAPVYAESVYFGTVVMADGAQILPNIAIPTPAEVSSAQASALAARVAANAATAAVVALSDTATTLQAETSALNGTALVYASCTSFGSQAIESTTNSTAQILAINLTSNVVGLLYIDIYTRYSEAPAGMPTVEHSVSLGAGGVTEWTALTDLGSSLTTYPVAGTDVECYKNTVAVSGANASGFFRVKAEAQQTVVGQFLVIYAGLTVNGRTGLTMYVEGLGQVVGGLLVEPVGE